MTDRTPVTEDDLDDVDCAEDVEFVDTRRLVPVDRECGGCGALVYTTMAQLNEEERSGPGYVCVECGRVDRI